MSSRFCSESASLYVHLEYGETPQTSHRVKIEDVKEHIDHQSIHRQDQVNYHLPIHHRKHQQDHLGHQSHRSMSNHCTSKNNFPIN